MYGLTMHNFPDSAQISESLRRFGISDTTTGMVIAKVGSEAEEVRATLEDLIKGDETPLDQIENFTDLKSVRKYYKLGDTPQAGKQEVLNLVVGSMALKDIN
ncbi:kinase binding protein CGI-121-domain-containing protein [Jimgerdemannia flammicorona]|uniref:EKC/KEOPS complex subunit CGI121 n=1 Tax=Jimgerdemannia flammicorona TaxID=994334 RepID=A0A433DDX3_9FUNG|nr:kinase binding protein CGI-121-domain-containing protein [Jimgerdemannia flammicorona]